MFWQDLQRIRQKLRIDGRALFDPVTRGFLPTQLIDSYYMRPSPRPGPRRLIRNSLVPTETIDGPNWTEPMREAVSQIFDPPPDQGCVNGKLGYKLFIIRGTEYTLFEAVYIENVPEAVHEHSH